MVEAGPVEPLGEAPTWSWLVLRGPWGRCSEVSMGHRTCSQPRPAQATTCHPTMVHPHIHHLLSGC